MVIDDSLHFAAIDVLATTNNHVLCAIDDVYKTLIINSCDVAGIQPSIFDCLCICFWTIQIALNNNGATHTQDAHSVWSWWQIVAVFIDKFSFQCGH